MTHLIRPRDVIDLRRLSLRREFQQEELPPTVGAAYDFAAATIGLLGRPVAAWKLGATTAGTRKAFSTEEIYFGPLLFEEVWVQTSGERVPAPRLLRGEAEIAFRLAVDIEAEESKVLLAGNDQELFDCWAPAIEAPYSCVENIPEAGLVALLVDRCSAGALYLGAPRYQMDDPRMMDTLEIFAGGRCLAQGSAQAALLLSPRKAALGFLAVAAMHGVNVRRGQWISTGGITTCVAMPFNQPIQLRLGGDTVLEVLVPEPKL